MIAPVRPGPQVEAVRFLAFVGMCGAAALACHHAVPVHADFECQASARDTTRPPARAANEALSAAQRDALVAEARARRAAWRALGITDYHIRVAVGCFCPWPQEPRILDVRDGKAVALLDTLERPAGKLREPWAPNTVEGLFDYIEQAARSADVVGVRYDPCLGYPTEIRGDQKLGRFDDWFWVKATDLTPRR